MPVRVALSVALVGLSALAAAALFLVATAVVQGKQPDDIDIGVLLFAPFSLIAGLVAAVLVGRALGVPPVRASFCAAVGFLLVTLYANLRGGLL